MGVVSLDLLRKAVSVLNILYWVNYNFKISNRRHALSITSSEIPINRQEFNNDAVNNNVDLRQMMIEWVENTKR